MEVPSGVGTPTQGPKENDGAVGTDGRTGRRDQRPPAARSRSGPDYQVKRSAASLLLEGRGWIYMRLGSDVLLLLLATAAAQYGAPAEAKADSGVLIWFFPPVALAVLAIRGAYMRRIKGSIAEGIGQVSYACTVAAMLLVAWASFVQETAQPADLVARAWVFSLLYASAGRFVLGVNQRRARTNGLVGKRTLIVGAGLTGAHVERRITEQPDLGLVAIGYLDADPPPPERVPGRTAPLLGDPAHLGDIVDETGAEHVIFAFQNAPDQVLVPLIRDCERRDLGVSLVPRLWENVNVRMGVEHLGGLPVLGLRPTDPKGWQFIVKHALDRVGAAVLLFVLAPALILAAIAVKVSSPGPVFFRQLRVGRDGHEFEMLKLRSMAGAPEVAGEADAKWAARLKAEPLDIDEADPAEEEEEDTPAQTERRTPVGRFLRRYSLDELPQLFNVLLGDMSLVGPRPERTHYVEMFEESVQRYKDRHRVKSGLTGWAQVNGLRGQTSLADRVEWDNYYIENWSLWLDIKILFMTAVAVLRPSED